MVVVGLGPAGADHLLPVARRALERAAVRYVRTTRHPAVDDLAAEGLSFIPLDRHYDEAADLDAVYPAIVAELVEAAREHGEIAYAVPGNPAVAERTVVMLGEAGVEVRVVPGLSFAELAWARLGVDLLEGGRVVDGRSFTREDALSGGPLLVAQCDTVAVLSDVKLLLLEELPPHAPVTVLCRLGLPDERVETVALEVLDRFVAPDHLTSVFADLGEGAGREFARFTALVERLRGPGGCPWDAEQTHHSLTRHLIEEAYEVVETLEALPPDAPGGGTPVAPAAYARVEEELGDLTAQVVFHATLARETGAFTMRDVLRGIREKLVARHPHVFGDVEVDGAAEVMRNWEQIKADEKGSFVEDVPPGLPSLLYAHKLFRKAASAGLPPMPPDEAAAAVARDVARLPAADGAEAEMLVGELLATVALIAAAKGFDAESALRAWAGRFRDRFLALEALAAERGRHLASLAPDELGALWIEAAAKPRSS